MHQFNPSHSLKVKVLQDCLCHHPSNLTVFVKYGKTTGFVISKRGISGVQPIASPCGASTHLGTSCQDNPALFVFSRRKVSSLTIDAAAFRVKGFMRFVYHRKHMREEVRRQYSRFYDGRSRRHFYDFHRTGEVQPVACVLEMLRTMSKSPTCTASSILAFLLFGTVVSFVS